MSFQDRILQDFDEQLKQVDNLKWLPWIGKLYSNTRTIVLGESHYDDGDDWINDNINATRILVDKRLSGNRSKIFSITEKVLLSHSNPSQQQSNFIWESVIYWNLVPILMSERDERPNDLDFDTGWGIFFKIIEILQPKPTTCIVLGKSSCGRLGYYLNNNDTFWNRNVEEFYAKEKIITLSNYNHKLKLIFISHPTGSFGFDYKYWAQLISDNEPDLCQLLSHS